MCHAYLIIYVFFTTKESAQKWLAAQNILLNYAPISENYELQHDGHVAYISVDCKAQELHPKIWNKLVNSVLGQHWGQHFPPECLGMSLIWGVETSQVLSLEEQKRWLQNISVTKAVPLCTQLRLSHDHLGQVKRNLWQVSKPTATFYLHVYAVFSEIDSSEQKDLFNILTQQEKLDLLELALHKCYFQIEHYFKFRLELEILQQQLDGYLLQALEQQPLTDTILDDLTDTYLKFTNFTTRSQELYRTLQINHTNFHHSLSQIRLKHDHIFKMHDHRLQQNMKQIYFDNEYHHALSQRVQIGLNLLQTKHNAQQEAQEKRSDDLITLLGLILGLTQVFPMIINIVQYICELPEEVSGLTTALNTGSILVLFGAAFWLYVYYRKN